MARMLRTIVNVTVVAVIVLGVVAGVVFFAGSGSDPTPIAQGFGLGRVPAFEGRPAVAQPIDVTPVAQHPFMARNGWNSMHGDGAASDTHPESGPLGDDARPPSACSSSCSTRRRSASSRPTTSRRGPR
jgi:hypothetical protein